jgi:putative ABC transport system permease protein
MALILTFLLLPPFNNLAAKELSLAVLGDFRVLLILAAVAGLTGLVAGSYPALFLSSFQPVRVLKSSLSAGTRGAGFRKILVVVQFSLSVLLIISTILVSAQLRYMRNYKLGYDKEHLITLAMRGEMRDKFDAVKNELLLIPDIRGVTASSNIPTYGYMFSNSLWRWEGQGPEEEILMRALTVDDDYFEVFGMEILQGRAFDREPEPEKNPVFIVNEEAARVMRMKEPVGQWLEGSGMPRGMIVGLVKDYHFTSLRQKIDPLILIYHRESASLLTARLSGRNIPRAIASIEDVWKKFAPVFPFRYRFLDEALDDLYRAEQRTGTIFRAFSLLAVIVSCLGLFGLSSFLAEQRTREIGIRKVLGASTGGIVFLFSKEFTKWVAFSNLFAWPAAYFAARKWLEGYAYRIDLGIGPFLAAAAAAVLIALATVSYHSFRSAGVNPADAIRYE